MHVFDASASGGKRFRYILVARVEGRRVEMKAEARLVDSIHEPQRFARRRDEVAWIRDRQRLDADRHRMLPCHRSETPKVILGDLDHGRVAAVHALPISWRPVDDHPRAQRPCHPEHSREVLDALITFALRAEQRQILAAEQHRLQRHDLDAAIVPVAAIVCDLLLRDAGEIGPPLRRHQLDARHAMGVEKGRHAIVLVRCPRETRDRQLHVRAAPACCSRTNRSIRA
jgi:hypothetical protein